MSQLTLDTIQLGSSATATQNLVVKTNKDGTFTIARGNDGSTTQDILKIDSSGRIQHVQPVVFSAYRGSNAAISGSTWVKVALDNEFFDPCGWFDTTNNRWTPQIAGYYQFNGEVRLSASGGSTAFYCSLAKNGSIVSYGQVSQVASTTAQQHVVVSDIIFCNGSTDYVELFAYCGGTGTVLIEGQASTGYTRLSGGLIG